MGAPVFLAIPETGVLRHAQMSLSSDMLYYNTSTLQTGADSANTASGQALHYQGNLAFGFENRAEVSFQYGQGFSMGLKALLCEEDTYLPDVVFGIRNLFESQEADLYGLPDSLNKGMRGESYFGAAKHLGQSTRLTLGASLLNGANKSPVGFYSGLEWSLGAGAVASYEVFERFSDFHQLLGLSWRFQNLFSLTVALSEVQSWLRQDGEWGFYFAPAQPQTNGYDSPGIRVSLSVFAFMPKIDRRTFAERLADLEEKNRQQEQALRSTQADLGTLKSEQEVTRRAMYQLANGNRGLALEGPEAEFRVLVDLYKSENSDPASVRAQVGKLLAYQDKARAVLDKAASDVSASDEVRVAALLAMATSHDTAYAPLLVALCRDDNPRIRREAITSLAQVEPSLLTATVTPMLKDPDDAVALTARTALQDQNPSAPSTASASSDSAAAHTPASPGASSAGKANGRAKAARAR